MEKLLILIVLLTSQIALGQVIEQTNTKSSQELYDYHTLKQQQNKKTAWILLGSGAAMTVTGFVILTNNSGKIITEIFIDKNSNSGTASSLLIIGGGATSLASIPFFISAGKHSKKATLSLRGEQNIVSNIKIDNSNCVALNIIIHF
jgi:hypothetical protein